MDECGRAGLRKCSGDDVEKGDPLDLAMIAKSGGDAGEVGIVVAGMADELPCAFFGQMLEEVGQGGHVEVSGSRDADSAVGGGDAAVSEIWIGGELAMEGVEDAHLQAAECCAVTERQIP